MARLFRPNKSRSSTPKNQSLTLTIERLSDDGRGIAHHQGKTLFVGGALPGEVVEAKVIATSTRYSEAMTSDVIESSPIRQKPRCSHFHQCGGCDWQHMGVVEQLAHKQQVLQQQLQRWANIQPGQWSPPLTGSEFGYRQRVRLAVKGGRLGFRQRDSKNIVAIDQCPIMMPALEKLISPLSYWLKHDLPPVTHIECVAADSGVGLVLRHTGAIPLPQRQNLQNSLPMDTHCWFQGNKQGPLEDVTGAIVDPRLTYSLDGGLTLACHPQDFIQSNRWVNQAMVNQAIAWLQPQPTDTVVDLFCGIGNFSLPLSRHCRQVTAVEGVAAMVARGRDSALSNQCENIVFQQADLFNRHWLTGTFGPCDGLLLDPPRNGAELVCQHIGKLNPKRIVYVSCNSATFVRDAQLLHQSGYRLMKAGILDMFPQTAHSEVMGLFVHSPRKA